MPEIETSFEKLAETESEAQRLQRLYNQVKAEIAAVVSDIPIAADASYHDKVINNLLLSEFLLAHRGTAEEYSEAEGQLRAVADYLALLKSYPDYRAAEISNAHGAFPDILNTWEHSQQERVARGLPQQSPSTYYIQESKKRLQERDQISQHPAAA